MSNTNENEESDQNVAESGGQSEQLVDAQVQLQASSNPIPQDMAMNGVENVKVDAPATASGENVEPEAMSECTQQQEDQNILHPVPVESKAQHLVKIESEQHAADMKAEVKDFSQTDTGIESVSVVGEKNADAVETVKNVKPEACEVTASKTCNNGDSTPMGHNEPAKPHPVPVDAIAGIENGVKDGTKVHEDHAATPVDKGDSNSKHSFLAVDYDGNESGTDAEQSAFMKELEIFFRERSMEFKPPKFYGEGLNCLKLWRAVTRLGGYDKVTSCKLWRQVGESFKPPKTCTTVSWTFRGFYEKALLDYERHKTKGGELTVPIASHSEPINIENQASASGRARRDAAARAMQGWHSQRLLGNGEVSDPIIKDRTPMPMQKREKQLKSINLLKRKKPSYMDNAVKAARSKPSKPQLDTAVVDIGPPADWVKINVQKTKDCFEVYALVPGLLREEVRVQSDPAGRLVISGEPEHPDNPWGVTPFKKVVSLPSRIDPHQTSAVVTLHGQLFVRVPFEQSE